MGYVPMYFLRTSSKRTRKMKLKNNQFFAHMVTYGYTDKNGTEQESQSEIVTDLTEVSKLYRKHIEEHCKEVGDWCCIDDVIIEVDVDSHGSLRVDITQIDCHAFYKKED